MKKTEKLLRKRYRRDCSSQIPMHIPNCTTSLRTILDRTSAGLPVNARVAEHVPLPPDGEDMEDFETGTAEYLDLVDVMHLSDRVKAFEEEQKRKQEEEIEKKKKEEFDKAVALEVAKQTTSP